MLIRCLCLCVVHESCFCIYNEVTEDVKQDEPNRATFSIRHSCEQAEEQGLWMCDKHVDEFKERESFILHITA